MQLREELRLRQMRPTGLPLVLDEAASEELEPAELRGDRAQSSCAPLRTQGTMPERTVGESVGDGSNEGKKTEGPLENPDGLERDMENFMFDFLQKQTRNFVSRSMLSKLRWNQKSRAVLQERQVVRGQQ